MLLKLFLFRWLSILHSSLSTPYFYEPAYSGGIDLRDIFFLLELELFLFYRYILWLFLRDYKFYSSFDFGDPFLSTFFSFSLGILDKEFIGIFFTPNDFSSMLSIKLSWSRLLFFRFFAIEFRYYSSFRDMLSSYLFSFIGLKLL